MPALINADLVGKKRKRVNPDETSSTTRKVKSTLKKVDVSRESPSQVDLLEHEIIESQKHYNNIAILISLAKKESKLGQHDAPATIALCRVFCRLLVDGRLSKSRGTASNETVVADWLKERYNDYQRILLASLKNPDFSAQARALSLSMQLVREEVANAKAAADSVWRTAFFSKVVFALFSCGHADSLCQDYTVRFASQFDDVRHYTFKLMAQYLTDEAASADRATIRSNSLSILSAIDVVDQGKGNCDALFCEIPEKANRGAIPFSAHRKQAQQAWLALLHSGLEKDQRKTVLGYMTYRIVPWFQNVELLMDFLTDSYNAGGATSLLSLSGLFYLIQEKNLDYPDFFMKLYSLLDSNLMHSKHRSRFFRLLNTFMSSTHLPAALVASFIKRLSRLALDAPPAAVVAVVPWIYNMLKSHPTCTFMIHREVRTAEDRQRLEEEGMDDPFDMAEQDPMETRAVESCLWELVTLQSHYHPNVASLAKIISEQFTKVAYNLEDFLDHSYTSLLETELGKELRKTPVVEFEIPKKIFTTSSGDATLERLMESILAA